MQHPLADAQGWAGLRYLQPLILLWLAFFFGRTLRRGSTALIERIARRSNAMLPPTLCRYCRRLTAIWCGYFVAAAALSVVLGASGGSAFGGLGVAILVGSVLLFVAEHRLRPRLFPNEVFPDLLQQLRDTWSIWRRPDGGGSTPQR